MVSVVDNYQVGQWLKDTSTGHPVRVRELDTVSGEEVVVFDRIDLKVRTFPGDSKELIPWTGPLPWKIEGIRERYLLKPKQN